MATPRGTLIRTSTLPPLTVSGLVETVVMSRSSGDLAAAAIDPAVSRPAIKIAVKHRKSRDELNAPSCIVSSPFMRRLSTVADLSVYLKAINPSQTYLKFPDQTAWVSLSVGYPRTVATRPVSSSE